MREDIQAEISKWDAALERSVNTPEAIAVEADQKAERLIVTYSGTLRQKDRPGLAQKLAKGGCYDVACFIVSRLMGIRVRDLQSKSA
jgi:hypothetical protein